jgi:hypothetical protein
MAIVVMFAFGYICSSSKDDKKEDTKKEDTKKEDIKKEDTKREDTKTEDTRKEQTKSGEALLYFCEEYRGGEEIGKSDVFLIGSGGGYFTCMIDLRPTGRKIGSKKVELRILKDGSTNYQTEKFDVDPDWDYIYFDKFHTFYSPGFYKVTALTPDGSNVATGEVTIKYK